MQAHAIVESGQIPGWTTQCGRQPFILLICSVDTICGGSTVRSFLELFRGDVGIGYASIGPKPRMFVYQNRRDSRYVTYLRAEPTK